MGTAPRPSQPYTRRLGGLQGQRLAAAATRKGRRNACRLFLMRHGRDKDGTEVMRGWAFDKVLDLKDWRS